MTFNFGWIPKKEHRLYSSAMKPTYTFPLKMNQALWKDKPYHHLKGLQKKDESMVSRLL